MSLRLTSMLAILAVASSASAISPDNLNLITFENRTGSTISYIFLSPSDSRHWGSDILGSTRTLADDDDLGFYINYPNSCNEFDIYAVGPNDSAYLLYGYEICGGSEATVRLRRRDLKEAAPDFDYTTVTIENDTDYQIQYLFLSPTDSDMWGVDQLDQYTVLDPGEDLSVLLPVDGKQTRYDVRAVDEDEDTYTFFVEIDPDLSSHTFTIVNSDLD